MSKIDLTNTPKHSGIICTTKKPPTSSCYRPHSLAS